MSKCESLETIITFPDQQVHQRSMLPLRSREVVEILFSHDNVGLTLFFRFKEGSKEETVHG